MRNALIVFLLITNGLTAQTKESVAVVDLSGSGFTKDELISVTARIIYEISQTNRFTVVDRDKRNEILDEQQFQLSGCTSDGCVVEIGKLVGVEKMISGTATKIGTVYSINLKMTDVSTGAIVVNIIEDFDGNLKDFIQITLKNAALKLVAESASRASSTLPSISEKMTVTKKGDALFTFSESGVNVYINGIFVMQTDKSELPLTLSEGLHTVKFTKDGFADWEKSLNIITDSRVTYDVKLQSGKSTTGTKTAFGTIYIKSTPDNADIFIDGAKMGKTPYQQANIGAGKHEIRIEKDLYYPHIEPLEVQSGGLATLTANLKPKFGSLAITSDPTDAVVKINGQVKGKTPYQIDNIASGTYQIELSKDLYHPYIEQFMILDGSSNVRPIRLNPAFGTLLIETEPTNAHVQIDGQPRGPTPLKIEFLPSGNYRIGITQNLYESVEKTILVEDGKTLTIMEKLKPAFGLLTITGEPSGAEVFIDDEKIGVIPINEYRLSTGFKQVCVQTPNYHPYYTQTEIRLSQTAKVDVELQRHTGNLIVMTTPPEADISLNNSSVGTSPLVLNDFPTGKYSLTAKLYNYLSTEDNFELKLNETKQINLQLLTYAGSIQQKIDGVRRKQFFTLGGAGLSMLASGVCYLIGSNALDAYDRANSTSAVNRAKNTFNFSQTMIKVCLGATVSFGIGSSYYQFQILNLKKEMNDGLR